MTKSYDAIIVGDRPAGLFAAMELTHGEKVVIIDKGRSIESRKCPMKLGSPECVQCRPCNVVCGWGGAGAFSDGKLTLTPEFGGNLEEYCGREKLLSLIAEADETYLRHGASKTLFEPSGDLAKRVISRALQAGLDIIPQRSATWGRTALNISSDDVTRDDERQLRRTTGAPADRVLLKADGSVAGVAL